MLRVVIPDGQAAFGRLAEKHATMYNLTMTQGLYRAARIASVMQFCFALFAFQSSPDGPLEITPRVPPGVSTPPAGGQTALHVNSSLVLIPVRVVTQSGLTVMNLKKDDFILSEDGARRTITYFARDDAPVSVGVLLDVSNSMKNKMRKSAEAATEFFRYAAPDDEFFLVEFNGSPKLKVPFTSEWQAIAAEIARAKASGLTALLDALHLGVAQLKHAHNSRKALIVLSDGGDNFSRRTLRELTGTLVESDVQVYSMDVIDENYEVKHSREEREGPKLLGKVALETGGLDFPLIHTDGLPDIGVRIARAMRDQYILGFAPSADGADGKYHKIALKLASPDAEQQYRAFYRRGYYAPPQ